MPEAVIGLVTRDQRLVADLRRLAAVTGQTVRVVSRPDELPIVWRDAAAVFVDASSVDLVTGTVVRRRDGVVLLSDDTTSADCWRTAAQLGAVHALSSAHDEPEILRLFALAGEPGGPQGPMIGVTGGSGGVGASLVATALACALACERDVTLVDLDVHGGGLDLLLGLENVDGLRWPGLRDARGVISGDALRQRLPTTNRVAVLSADRVRGSGDDATPAAPTPEAVSAVTSAARRGGGAVVADLPRVLTEAARACIADCDVLVVVVSADIRGLAAAAAVIDVCRRVGVDPRLLCRTGSRRSLRPAQIESALRIPVVGVIAHEPALATAADLGRLPSALPRSKLHRLCTSLLSKELAALVG